NSHSRSRADPEWELKINPHDLMTMQQQQEDADRQNLASAPLSSPQNLSAIQTNDVSKWYDDVESNFVSSNTASPEDLIQNATSGFTQLDIEHSETSTFSAKSGELSIASDAGVEPLS